MDKDILRQISALLEELFPDDRCPDESALDYDEDYIEIYNSLYATKQVMDDTGL